ncbi:MAG: hypothetical protein KGQ35_06305 [Burkholderiales bacterium]|jgi:hypothetical protein|nr:hypothetical protein [Burkholderiales bacterium]
MRTAILAGLLVVALSGCAVVPAGPYGAYGPAVVVTPFYYGHYYDHRGYYGR